MISNNGILKLFLDLAKVPLIDTHTKRILVDNKLFNDPEYLVCTLVMEGIYFISREDLIQAKKRYKLDYKHTAKVYKHRSEDMKELNEQRKYR